MAPRIGSKMMRQPRRLGPGTVRSALPEERTATAALNAALDAEEEAAPLDTAFRNDPTGADLVAALSNIIHAKLGTGNDPQDYDQMVAMLTGMGAALIVARCFGDLPGALAMAHRAHMINVEQITRLIDVYPADLEKALAQ